MAAVSGDSPWTACLCPPSVAPPPALQARSVPPFGPVLASLRDGLAAGLSGLRVLALTRRSQAGTAPGRWAAMAVAGERNLVTAETALWLSTRGLGATEVLA
jgi:hypothetical protein